MKNHFHFCFLLAFLCALSFSSCHRDSLFGVHGSGSTVTETRSPGSFSGVDMSIDANVVLHVDPVCRVVLSGQQNVLNVLSTEVHGNVLKLGFSRNVHSHNQITIDVYAPSYSEADISGSGNIQSTEAWACSDFQSSISGSGSLSLLSVTANTVHTSISGSGSVTLGGNCTSLNSSISGSGSIHAFSLGGQSGEIHVSGSGKAELNLTQSITVHISGSGDVLYKNNPVLDVHMSGSGQLIHVQ